MIVTVLLIALAVMALAYVAALVRAAVKRSELKPKLEGIGIGAVANYFDTLGIGSFAPTTAWLKLRRLVPDDFIPGVLVAGHCLPTMVQALVFINLVRVDPLLLLACIGSAVLGSLVGAPLVQRTPVRLVQAIVGIALLIAAALYALTNLKLMPGGGDALSLSGGLFAVAVAAHFIMGALMTFGIGLYAPSLILLSLFGLDPKAAFPIMMGACAFLMPVSGFSFVQGRRIDLKLVLGMAIGGVPAVLAAAFLVKSLPLEALRWGVVVVVLYAAALLLNSAIRGAEKAPGSKIPG
jgi:uncharacterized membrane protein YfcA